MTPADALPVGIVEIAERLQVQRATVDKWQVRGLLPEPRWTVGGRPAWDWWDDIVPWARRTSRIPMEARRAAVETHAEKLAETGWSQYSKALRDPAYRAEVVEREMAMIKIQDNDEDPGDHDHPHWI